MKNVSSALFEQVNNNVISRTIDNDNITVLPSNIAWSKFSWTKQFFKKKPKEGYFIWVKKQTNTPLTTCLAITSSKVMQDLSNLLVLEQGVKIKANTLCQTVENDLYGTHKAEGIIVLKKESSLDYTHTHNWNNRDLVNTNYSFILEEHSRLTYSYKSLSTPKKLSLKTKVLAKRKSSANFKIVAKAKNSEIKIVDKAILKDNDAKITLKLRLVGEFKSNIVANSEILALNTSKGHLDCQGLLLSNNSKIALTPKIVCQDKNAQITHEALIGSINEEQLTYLMTRGFAEQQAIDLIVNGFLKK